MKAMIKQSPEVAQRRKNVTLSLHQKMYDAYKQYGNEKKAAEVVAHCQKKNIPLTV